MSDIVEWLYAEAESFRLSFGDRVKLKSAADTIATLTAELAAEREAKAKLREALEPFNAWVGRREDNSGCQYLKSKTGSTLLVSGTMQNDLIEAVLNARRAYEETGE